MLSLLAVLALFAQTEEPDFCADARNCRHVGVIVLRVNGEVMPIQANAELPFVTQEGLTLMLGESVVIRLDDGQPVVESTALASDVADQLLAEQAAEELRSSGPVDESIAIPMTGRRPPVLGAPADRLRLSFFQVDGSEETMLIIENGYAQKVGFLAHMQTPHAAGLQYTTTCEVLPNLPSLEHWPEPIVFIQLSDFAFSADDRRVACD